MITLNDYLYGGHTVRSILKRYKDDLHKSACETGNEVDLIHCNFLIQMMELLEHNDFLTAQSQKIREFYKYMAAEYPHLAFTFKGRIKSLIRAEAKFNGYIMECISKYYGEHGCLPSDAQLKEKLTCFRDLIAYRIVISVPKCHLKPGDDQQAIEKEYLYEIANVLPRFMEQRGFTPESANEFNRSASPLLIEEVKPFYRDYITEATETGYQSLHITFYDNSARCYVEMQLRTKEMDDIAEIGPANHWGYEKKQESERGKKDVVPKGISRYFDEAYERGKKLREIDLAKVDVNMFGAVNNDLVNDGCGLYRGRLILPYEHLSHFQNDVID